MPNDRLITNTLLEQLGEELRQEIFYETGILIGAKDMSFDISGDTITAKLWGYEFGCLRYGEKEADDGFGPSDLAIIMIDAIEDMDKKIIRFKIQDIEKNGLPGLKADIITILKRNWAEQDIIDLLDFSIKDLGYDFLNSVDIAEKRGFPLIVIAIRDRGTIDFKYPLNLWSGDRLVDDVNDLVFRFMDEMAKVESLDE